MLPQVQDLAGGAAGGRDQIHAPSAVGVREIGDPAPVRRPGGPDLLPASRSERPEEALGGGDHQVPASLNVRGVNQSGAIRGPGGLEVVGVLAQADGGAGPRRQQQQPAPAGRAAGPRQRPLGAPCGEPSGRDPLGLAGLLEVQDPDPAGSVHESQMLAIRGPGGPCGPGPGDLHGLPALQVPDEQPDPGDPVGQPSAARLPGRLIGSHRHPEPPSAGLDHIEHVGSRLRIVERVGEAAHRDGRRERGASAGEGPRDGGGGGQQAARPGFLRFGLHRGVVEQTQGGLILGLRRAALPLGGQEVAVGHVGLEEPARGVPISRGQGINLPEPPDRLRPVHSPVVPGGEIQSGEAVSGGRFRRKRPQAGCLVQVEKAFGQAILGILEQLHAVPEGRLPQQGAYLRRPERRIPVPDLQEELDGPGQVAGLIGLAGGLKGVLQEDLRREGGGGGSGGDAALGLGPGRFHGGVARAQPRGGFEEGQGPFLLAGVQEVHRLADRGVGRGLDPPGLFGFPALPAHPPAGQGHPADQGEGEQRHRGAGQPPAHPSGPCHPCGFLR